MRDSGFYQAHLDRVSRSFAFCIQKLDPPLRGWVSLSYLLCRVLDTVEDSPWTDPALRDEQYRDFDAFMTWLPEPRAVLEWAARFPTLIPPGEKDLLTDAHALFGDLHGMPPGARAVIQKGVRQMSRGMRTYSDRAGEGVLKLRDLVDVNRYCYFVAGVVGELLSKLLMENDPDFVPPADFLKNSFHFGLFLQKVNLLKDQLTDETEGRYLVPDRRELLASLRENAEGALEYLLALPVEEKGFRTFCAWSLFLGAASLSWIEKRFAQEDGTKIPRSVTQELLSAIEEIVQDNEALREGFREHFPQLPPLERARKPGLVRDGDWFSQLSAESLGPTEIIDLRMN